MKKVAVNDSSSNTFDHIPVIGTFHITRKKATKQQTKIMSKPKWDNCDKISYRNSVKENLQPFDTFLPSLNTESDILQPLSHLNAVLKQATINSISEVTIRQIEPDHGLAGFMTLSKTAVWWEWQKAGSFKNPSHETVKRRRASMKTLRKQQRQEAARARKDKVEEIMNSRNDP